MPRLTETSSRPRGAKLRRRRRSCARRVATQSNSRQQRRAQWRNCDNRRSRSADRTEAVRTEPRGDAAHGRCARHGRTSGEKPNFQGGASGRRSAAQTTPAEGQASPHAARLISRASALLAREISVLRGSCSSKRRRRAARRRASCSQRRMMPDILSAWGTYGTRGEVTKARSTMRRRRRAAFRRQRID